VGHGDSCCVLGSSLRERADMSGPLFQSGRVRFFPSPQIPLLYNGGIVPTQSGYSLTQSPFY